MATCAHCGYESPDLTTCPLCGTAAAPASVQGAETVATQAALPEWENPELRFPLNLFHTWRRSVLEPGSFFAGVPHEAAAIRPILYYMLVTVLGAFFMLWWSAVFSTVQMPLLAMLSGLADPSATGAVGATAAAGPLINFFLAPFGAIIYLVVWGLWLHLFVLMFGRKRRNITATIRSICYSSGPSLLAVVPIVGWMVGGVWTLVLTVFAIRAAHRMTTGAAAATVLIATFLPLALMAVLMVVLFAAMASIGM